jgi:methyl-accepting chemotaxis protein
MKVKFKLSIWLIAIMVIVATVITILLLWQASELSLNLNLRSLEHIIGSFAKFCKGRENGCINALHKLANIMGDYETIRAGERRDKYDELLKSTLEADPQMVLLYTVWKPNAIDGMDELSIGRTDSSPTGQYAMTYIKETSTMIKRVNADIESSMAYITGPDAHKDRIDNPTLRKINGKDMYTIKMMVPIINDNNNEVVGTLGCLLVIDVIQRVLENVLNKHDEIAIMMMYSYDGTILAHFKPERIGRNMLDVDVEFGDFRRGILEAVKNGQMYEGIKYDPQLDDNIRFLVKPVKIGGFNNKLSVLIGVPESYVLKEIKAIAVFSILMALIAFFVTAAIIFAVGCITKPVIIVTDTFRGISEGKIDFTRLIPEKRILINWPGKFCCFKVA